jgi:guanylate kinase
MNELKQIEEFRKVLTDYQPSSDAKDALESIKLVLLVGPTSSGRNSIINELLKSDHYHAVVSDTTRNPRQNNGIMEQNGREYWFRSEEDMLKDLSSGQFLEAAIIHNQQVSGISVRELKQATANQKIAINEIEVVGADNVHQANPHAIFIFVIPPSFDEWMARMSSRGQLPADETKRRLSSAVKEITMALDRDFYHFVVNDTFVQTAKKVDAIAKHNETDTASQDAAREVASILLNNIKDYLGA